MEFLKISNIVSYLITIELCSVISDGDKVKVTTTYGKIQGNVHHFEDINRTIKAVDKFLGIPYAAPPVGDLRFKPPQQPQPWKPAIYNASFFRNVCIQDPEYNDFFWPNLTIPQSEDCLYLNVYSPHRDPDSEELYPVMVYIHGGGYDAGSPAVSPGDVIPLWGIVLVTIQYRLGPFGFITSGDCEAPGNYGMLDQIEALEWVQHNIKFFGGNSSAVTIFGESAGGSSVGLLVLSPLSKALFHRAISISGVDLSPFAIGSSEEVTKQSKKVAKQVGCSVKESRKMIECLRSVDAFKFPVKEVNVWRPIVDNNFLPDTPRNLRKAGRFHYVPYMAGFTSREGSYFFPQLLDDVTSENFRSYTETVFYNIGNKYGQMLEENLPKALLDAITLLYTPWSDREDDIKTKVGLADAVGDFTMTAPTHTDLILHSKHAPVFMYEFAHRSNLNPRPLWKGVAHKDDTPYEFGFPLMNLTVLQQYNDADRNVSDMLITLFTNFAKYGNPTPQPVLGVTWERFNSSHKAYISIQRQPKIAVNYRPTRMAFWSEYYERMLVKDPYVCEVRSSALKKRLSFSCLVVFVCFLLINTLLT